MAEAQDPGPGTTEATVRRKAADWRAAPLAQKHDALLQGVELTRAKAWLENARDRLSQDESDFIEASLRRARGRAWLVGGLAVVILILIAAAVTPRLYGEYARRAALDCDLLAAEENNNAHLPGVALESIVPDVAIPVCEHAIAADPQNPRLMRNLGRAFEKAGRSADAAFWYRRALETGSQ
jgi:tetratricopeptide (TPR) repeat protein